MTILNRAPLHSAGFDFSPLSATEWRITDPRRPRESIQALIGFVALHDGAFYVTRMNHPLESTPFSSIDAVGVFLTSTPGGADSPYA